MSDEQTGNKSFKAVDEQAAKNQGFIRRATGVLLGISILIGLGGLAFSLYITHAFSLRPLIEATYIMQAMAAIFAVSSAILAFRRRGLVAIMVFVLAIDCFVAGYILQLSSLVYF